MVTDQQIREGKNRNIDAIVESRGLVRKFVGEQIGVSPATMFRGLLKPEDLVRFCELTATTPNDVLPGTWNGQKGIPSSLGEGEAA